MEKNSQYKNADTKIRLWRIYVSAFLECEEFCRFKNPASMCRQKKIGNNFTLGGLGGKSEIVSDLFLASYLISPPFSLTEPALLGGLTVAGVC